MSSPISTCTVSVLLHAVVMANTGDQTFVTADPAGVQLTAFPVKATDSVLGDFNPVCTSNTGATVAKDFTFLPGVTTVTCRATGSAGDAQTASFTVTIGTLKHFHFLTSIRCFMSWYGPVCQCCT